MVRSVSCPLQAKKTQFGSRAPDGSRLEVSGTCEREEDTLCMYTPIASSVHSTAELRTREWRDSSSVVEVNIHYILPQ